MQAYSAKPVKMHSFIVLKPCDCTSWQTFRQYGSGDRMVRRTELPMTVSHQHISHTTETREQRSTYVAPHDHKQTSVKPDLPDKIGTSTGSNIKVYQYEQ